MALIVRNSWKVALAFALFAALVFMLSLLGCGNTSGFESDFELPSAPTETEIR